MSNKERIIVLVRAIPEESKKYGHKVCVAGINEAGEWRRLYPFKFIYGQNLIDFRKKDIIEVNLKEPDNDKRKESRKVESHKKVDSLDDKQVLDKIIPLMSSVEKLKERKASLGVVKPLLESIEVKINDTNLYDSQQYLSLTEDFLEKRERVKMPIELRYIFKCKNEEECKKPHRMILIDWELNELTRNILKQHQDKNTIEQKIKDKFSDFMKERDLYFFLGTHFRWGTWIIIGLFYPHKNLRVQKALDQF
jgi:hypothetical protein